MARSAPNIPKSFLNINKDPRLAVSPNNQEDCCMRFFVFRLMGSLLFSIGALAAPGSPIVPQIREVNLPIEHVFILKGFDSNDALEVFVSGWYANPCQEW